MSRRGSQAELAQTPAEDKPVVRPKSHSVLAGTFRLAGLCRTKNGWAIAVAEIDGDGQLIGLELGDSQTFPEHVVSKLVKRQMAINQMTLRQYPWRPG